MTLAGRARTWSWVRTAAARASWVTRWSRVRILALAGDDLQLPGDCLAELVLLVGGLLGFGRGHAQALMRTDGWRSATSLKAASFESFRLKRSLVTGVTLENCVSPIQM